MNLVDKKSKINSENIPLKGKTMFQDPITDSI
jgi:hypothetical protein